MQDSGGKGLAGDFYVVSILTNPSSTFQEDETDPQVSWVGQVCDLVDHGFLCRPTFKVLATCRGVKKVR